MSSLSIRSLSLALSLGLAVLVSFAASDASAYCRMTTEGGAQIGEQPCVEKGEPLIWTVPCLSYAIDSRGSTQIDDADMQAAVNAGFAAWEAADCGGGETPNLVFKPSAVPSTCKRAEFNNNGNVNTVAFLDPWRDPCAENDDPGYEPLAFAVTIVWLNTETGEILDADMMINDTQASPRNAGGPYADCPLSGCLGNDADLQSIITHEAGHFIGIGHSNDVEATMFASAERDSVSKRSLADDDINAVCDIYPPGSLDESCDATPMRGLQLNCETTSDGNPIACDAPGTTASQGGCACSTAQTPAGTLWATIGVLFGLTVMRRRSGRRVARS